MLHFSCSGFVSTVANLELITTESRSGRSQQVTGWPLALANNEINLFSRPLQTPIFSQKPLSVGLRHRRMTSARRQSHRRKKKSKSIWTSELREDCCFPSVVQITLRHADCNASHRKGRGSYSLLCLSFPENQPSSLRRRKEQQIMKAMFPFGSTTYLNLVFNEREISRGLHQPQPNLSLR